MPKQLQKSLQAYISKIKKPSKQLHLPSKTLSSSTNWILRGCKHPKTPSFSFDHHGKDDHQNGHAATLSDIDQFLFENFRSLYQKEYEDDKRKRGEKVDNNDEEKEKGNEKEKTGCSFLFESPRFLDLPLNFRGSHRFFIDHSASGSLIEEARISITTSEYMASSSTTIKNLEGSRTLQDFSGRINSDERDDNNKNNNDDEDNKDPRDTMGADDFITLLTYSPNPYCDFRRSMQEMVEARLHFHGKIDWEFMEELLFCYLNLNDKKLYKFILSAFVDLVVVLRENSGRVPGRSRNVRPTGER